MWLAGWLWEDCTSLLQWCWPWPRAPLWPVEWWWTRPMPGLCRSCKRHPPALLPFLSAMITGMPHRGVYPLGLRIWNMEHSWNRATGVPHFGRRVSWVRINACYSYCKPLWFGGGLWYQETDYIYIIYRDKKESERLNDLSKVLCLESGKHSIPVLFHILYAAFLYDKMNYQRASKVNQEFFLLRIKWDHMGHWRLLVTHSEVLYVCLLSIISDLCWSWAFRLI